MTFTKEQLIAAAHGRIDFANMMLPDNSEPLKERTWAIELRLAEIALAALTEPKQEPVAWRYRYVHTPKSEEHGSYFTTDWVITHSEDECNPSDYFERQPLYAAPPAQLSAPDFGALTKCIVQRLVDYGTADDEAIASAEEFVYNACRAAILQGADDSLTHEGKNHPEDKLGMVNHLGDANEKGNSPVIPDGWVACSERMPEEGGRYWCYVEEQNDLGKSHYQWNCAWNGGRWWVESDNGGRVTHWMPLPAAPQQEAK